MRRVRLLAIAALLVSSCAPAPSAQRDREGHRHRGGVPHRFDDAAEWAERFDDPARDAWQKPAEVIAALALPPDAVVADLGAGTGYFSVRLARVVPRGRVLAVDIEPAMVEWVEERARRDGLDNVDGVLARPDDARLPVDVDLVVVVDTYHHIEDRTAYFARLARRLRPGGRIAIVDFEPESERGPPAEHKLAPAVVIEELRAAGLTLVASHAFLPDQYFLVFARS
jgi:SAM-dependent methyltransferase